MAVYLAIQIVGSQISSRIFLCLYEIELKSNLLRETFLDSLSVESPFSVLQRSVLKYVIMLL